MNPEQAQVFRPTQKPVEELTDVEIIDEYSRLKIKLDAQDAILKPEQDRRDLCKKLILERQCKDLGKTESTTLTGQSFVIIVGARRKEKTVLLQKVWKKLGVKEFLLRCKFTFDALKEAIPDEVEQKKYYTEDETGWRSMKAVPKPE